MAHEDIFQLEEAPVILGVGKNMVRAIKFWGMASKILENKSSLSNKKSNLVSPTPLGHDIFKDRWGLDPDLERPETIWLLHWLLLAPRCMLPPWWVIMNEFSAAVVTTEDVTERTISKIDAADSWKRHSQQSIKRDIDVFVHTYTSKKGKEPTEDYLDCPLRGLHLLRQRDRGEMRFVFGVKPGMSPLTVAYACLDFVGRADIPGRTISVHKLAMEMGGPGNTFKISEADISDLLMDASERCDAVAIRNVNGMPHMTFDGDVKDAAREVLFAIYDRKCPNKKPDAQKVLAR